MKTIWLTKYMTVDWHKRPDGRRRKFKHNKHASSIYVQVRRLEIVVWYR